MLTLRNVSMTTRAKVVMNHDLLRLLENVARAQVFYEVLSPAASRRQELCDLESLGYIRYCPYPEEFWIVLPAGREFLGTSKHSRS
jgi:hypothetical protein